MNKSKAKELLQRQLEKLDSSWYRNDAWVFQTASIIEKAFGKESPECNYIGQFRFGTWSYRGESSEKIDWRLEEQRRKIILFLENCIESLEIHGIYRPTKKNFLSNLDTVQIWSTILGAGIVVFTAGYHTGHYFSDVQNFELHQQVKVLKDSLSTRPLTNIVPDDDSAKKSQKQSQKLK